MRTPSPEPPPVWYEYQDERRQRFALERTYTVGDHVIVHTLTEEGGTLAKVQVEGVVLAADHEARVYLVKLVTGYTSNWPSGMLAPADPMQPPLFDEP